MAILHKKLKRFCAIVATSAMFFTNIYSPMPILAMQTKTNQTNLALNKTVYYSSEEGTSSTGTDTHARNAVDGDMTTYWAANGKPNGTNWDAQYPEWLCVDLGKEYKIDEINLVFDGRDGKRWYGYNIYVSNNAPVNGEYIISNDFQKVVSREDNKQSTSASTPIIESITDTTGRYVLIEVTSCNQYDQNKWQVASIYELEIYGSPKIVSPDDPGPGVEETQKLQTASAAQAPMQQKLTASGCLAAKD